MNKKELSMKYKKIKYLIIIMKHSKQKFWMNFKHFLREMRKKLIVSVFRITTKLEIYLKNSGYLKKE